MSNEDMQSSTPNEERMGDEMSNESDNDGDEMVSWVDEGMHHRGTPAEKRRFFEEKNDRSNKP